VFNKHENTAGLIYKRASMKPRDEILIINDWFWTRATEKHSSQHR